MCYENTVSVQRLSENISLRVNEGCWNCDKFIFNQNTHRIANRTPLKWVMCNSDSLAVAATEGRRGYINRFSGEIVLPFEYTRAWLFSEGLAAVTDTANRLFFIHTDGSRAIDTSFIYDPAMRYEGYIFHGGHCIMTEGGRYGLIDREAKWCIDPKYDQICWRDQYWEVRQDDELMLLDTSLNVLVPMQKASESRVYDEAGYGYNGWHILVEVPNKPSKLYTPNGKLLTDRLYRMVEPLRYGTDEDGDGGKPSACMYYSNLSGQRGLISKDGQQLTDAIYSDIEALDYGLFRATITDYPNTHYVLLDAVGREIRK